MHIILSLIFICSQANLFSRLKTNDVFSFPSNLKLQLFVFQKHRQYNEQSADILISINCKNSNVFEHTF